MSGKHCGISICLRSSSSPCLSQCRTVKPQFLTTKGEEQCSFANYQLGPIQVQKQEKVRCPSSKALNQEKSGEIHSCSYLEQSYSFCSSQSFNASLRKSLLYFLYDLNVNLIQSPPHSNTQKHA